MLRIRVYTHVIALVFLTATLLVSTPIDAQSVVPGAPASSRHMLQTHATSLLAVPAADVSGHWRGNLGSPNDPSGSNWLEEIDFHQNADGSITGTRRTVPLQNAANWATWSITGNLSGTTLTFQDQALTGQGDTSRTPCPISVTAEITTEGVAFSGNWTSTHSGCAGGPISAAKDTVDSSKNMADGARCDAGEGSPFGRNNSSAGGAGGGANCPSINGSPNVGDPINASTGNYYVQQDDYIATPWLTFRRFYNSDEAMAPAYMGAHWRHSFDRSLQIFGSPASTIVMFRPDGKQETFKKSGDIWATELGVDQLTELDDAQGALTGYAVFIGASRRTEIYDTAGKIISVVGEDGQGITLTYSTASTSSSIAPRAGLLIAVQDPQGRKLQIDYYYNAKIHQVTLPDGHWLRYSYNLTTGNLYSVTYPDGKTRGYLYNESAQTGGANLPNALTGITDESGARYETVSYDGSGRATAAAFAGGVGGTHITYNGDGTSVVAFPLGYAASMGFTTADGLVRVGTVDQPCGPDCGQPWRARTYDSRGYPASYTGFDDVLTQVTYDAHGLLDKQTEAVGTSDQRTTETTWDPVLRLPLGSTISDSRGAVVASTARVYSAQGKMIARCEIDPTNGAATSYTCSASGAVPFGVRRWTYTYCDAVDGTQCPIVGLLLTATGPRTDLAQTTQYSYYMDSATAGCITPGGACHQAGDLYQVTDPLGHVTTYASYDADGRVTRITDANGVNTDLTYTPRGWLASRSVAGAVTTFGYKPYGAVQSITDPDGVTTTFGYDPAHRLTDITDAQGNHVHYTLDAAGNKTKEEIFDSAGTAHYSQSKTFNTLGQLTTIVDGLGHTVFNANTAGDYDANGNLLHSSDALGAQTQRSYDALNRLVGTIRDYNGTDTSTKNSTTTVAYDALDRVTGVSDPESLVTSYTYDGLGDLTHLQSPDTGLSGGSSGDGFDAAGNLTQHTDARGVVSQYTYDALNRLTGKIYPAHPALNVTYTYDQAAPIAGCPVNANIGHLTTMTDASGSTAWCYTAQGDISQVRQTINGVSYLQNFTYTPGRRLQTQQYPSGFALSYSYDSDGRVATVGYLQNAGPYGSYTSSTVTPLITAVSYLPFGPMSGYSWAQGGQNVLRTYDPNYALTDITGSALNLHFLRDAKSRIAAEGDTVGASPANESYHSDALDRLTQLTDANGATEQAFSYNLTGDRLSKTVAGQSTLNYGYQSGTHQLTLVGNASRSLDAAGNTTAMLTPNGTQVQLVYDDRNLLTQVQSGGNPIANYQYNGQGIRVWRSITAPSSGQAATVYDPLNTGNLYGEYFAADYREYVYLNGIPVASAMDAGRQAPAITYLHADGLGAVRVATTTAGAVTDQWPWLNNAFGDKAMTGASSYYLRFPGQYYDVETGLHYNGHRYYDPIAGRYIQSDPIGLVGGISTFAYARSQPQYYVDPSGNDAILLHNPSSVPIVGGFYGGHVAVAVGNDDTGWNFYSEGGLRNGVQLTTVEHFESLAALERNLGKAYTQQDGEHTDPLQDMLMNTYARDHLKDPYSWRTNNCGDFAMSVLRAGGLHPTANRIGPTIPNDISITNGPNDPNHFLPYNPYLSRQFGNNEPHYESPTDSSPLTSGNPTTY